MTVVQEIERGAKSQGISQGAYLTALFYQNKLLKMKKSFAEDLERLTEDSVYIQKQRELAEANFL